MDQMETAALRARQESAADLGKFNFYDGAAYAVKECRKSGRPLLPMGDEPPSEHAGKGELIVYYFNQGYKKGWALLGLASLGVEGGTGLPPSVLPMFKEDERHPGEAKSNDAGEILAVGEGYLEGLLKTEGWYAERVEARGSAILVHCSGQSLQRFPYSAADWFRVEPLPEGLAASKSLKLGSDEPVIALSFTEERWWLAVKSDELDRWRVIFEYFGVREAPQGN
jgi:hypothetical protein